MKERIHIVGGGLVGTLAAIYLAERNFYVTLHERRPDMRKTAISAGRSINLAVTSRGLKALSEVGLKDQVLAMAVPMKGRMLHDVEGKTSFVPYGQKESEVIHSVSRGDLNKLLLDKAESYGNAEIHFNRRCEDYDAAASELAFTDEASGRRETVNADVVIGADGAFSALRKAMQRVKGFEETQAVEAHGYKELLIPAAPGGLPTPKRSSGFAQAGGFLMEKNALHIWPRKSFMLIALPNFDGSFTVTLFLAHEGQESFASLKEPKDVTDFFSRHFPDAAALMPDLAKVFFTNPTGSMVTVKCRPWHSGPPPLALRRGKSQAGTPECNEGGNLMLIGDAAHAIVPFFGQGMNCGFEDCSALGSLLDKKISGWEALFAALEKERKENADAIADMALENFVEMRDTVADPKFQLKKQIGFELERRFPGKFIPRYAMVVFHPDIPYAEARKKSEAQDKLLETLAAGISSVDQVDWRKAAALFGEKAA